MPARLALCLVLLCGFGHTGAGETKRGIGERAEGRGSAVDGTAGVHVVECDVKGGGKCAELGPPVTGAGTAAHPVDEGAGEAVDEAAGPVSDVGECSGKRFKKCR